MISNIFPLLKKCCISLLSRLWNMCLGQFYELKKMNLVSCVSSVVLGLFLSNKVHLFFSLAFIISTYKNKRKKYVIWKKMLYLFVDPTLRFASWSVLLDLPTISIFFYLNCTLGISVKINCICFFKSFSIISTF